MQNRQETRGPKNPRVTDEVAYLTADEEDKFRVAQANEPIDENGYFVNKTVSGRYREETTSFQRSQVDLMDVSPRMVFCWQNIYDSFPRTMRTVPDEFQQRSVRPSF